MGSVIEILHPTPHAGQVEILGNLARFNTLRAGRRYGKTLLYYNPVLDAITSGHPIGLFTQEDKYLAEVWRDIKSRVKGAIVKCDDNERRMELIGGGLLEGWTLKSNEDPARSRKYKGVVIDEAGLIRKLRLIWFNAIRPTLIDLEGWAIIAGTSKVQWPDFNWFCRYAESGTDPDWRHFKGKTFDNPHLPTAERAEIEKQRALMPAWQFAQEYEGEEAESVSVLFPRATIDGHRGRWQRDPDRTGRLAVAGDPEGSVLDSMLTFKKGACIRWVDDERGPWRLWCELGEDGKPDPTRRYAAGWDLGTGVGSSNTVGAVGDSEAKTKIAEFVSPFVTPEAAAREALKASYFFGGVDKCAWINWEANGPGEKFGQDLMELHHPKKVRRVEGGVANDTGLSLEDYGWWNSAQSKETLLTDYRSDLASDRFINPSEKALDETLTYHWEGGRIVSIRIDADPIEEIARMPHGDRVMADAILRLAMERVGRLPPPAPPAPIPGTIGERVLAAKKKRRFGKKKAGMGW